MQPDIEEYVNSHPEWKTNVAGQCQSWLKEGLRPRAMTRDLDWGINVPLPDADGKVLYVWFDAPIGYISMTKEWAEEQGRDWELYWRDQHTKLVHFIGKDNIVFHCIIFPAMLMAEGSFILADNVPANEFMNLEGDKISTSRNWAVWLHEYLEEMPGQAGCTAVCAGGQRARNQRQRVYLEGFPDAEQCRTGGHFRQLREPGRGADAQNYGWPCAGYWES